MAFDAFSDLLGPEEAAFEEFVVPPPGAVPPDGPKHAHYVITKRLGGGAFGEVLQVRICVESAVYIIFAVIHVHFRRDGSR